jgi:hypothetical protein
MRNGTRNREHGTWKSKKFLSLRGEGMVRGKGCHSEERVATKNLCFIYLRRFAALSCYLFLQGVDGYHLFGRNCPGFCLLCFWSGYL